MVRWWSLLASLALSLSAGVARADSGQVNLAMSLPLRGQDEASPSEVIEAVGQPRYEVVCPEQRSFGILDASGPERAYEQRGFKATLPKPGVGYRDLRVLATVLSAGYGIAIQECPISQTTYNGVGDHGDMGEVQVFGEPGEGTGVQLLVTIHGYGANGGAWSGIRDRYAEVERGREAEQAESARLAQQEAASSAYAASEEARRRQTKEWQEREGANDRRFFAMLWSRIKLGAAIALVLWLLWHWKTFVRWYYDLTPHPAAHIVDEALRPGGSLNVRAFETAIAVEAGNSIEAAVRQRQLNEITARWRDYEQALRSREASIINAERDKARQQNELELARIAALEAALAHQMAAARVAELQRNPG